MKSIVGIIGALVVGSQLVGCSGGDGQEADSLPFAGTAPNASSTGADNSPNTADHSNDRVVPYSGVGDVKTATIDTPFGMTTLDYRIVDGRPMHGDMVIDVPEAEGFNTAVGKVNPWPGGVVAIEIGPDQVDAEGLLRSIQIWEQITGIRFVQRTTETSYISVFHGKDGECWSNLGRVGGKQLISLGAGCTGTGVASHELGHAIGLFHEHERADRDSYIKVDLNNVNSADWSNFGKVGFQSSGPYDISSLMHYGSTAFAKAPGLYSLLTVDGKVVADPSTGLLTLNDAFGVATLYANEKLPAGKGVKKYRTLRTTALREYANGGAVLGQISANTVIQGGSFVEAGAYAVYNVDGKPGWANAADIQIADDGAVVQPPPPPPPPSCGVMAVNQKITSGETITSCNGRFKLTMQSDGNLVEFGMDGRPLFNSGTFGHPGAWAIVQGDGNFVVYGASSGALWSAGTDGQTGSTLSLAADGEMRIGSWTNNVHQRQVAFRTTNGKYLSAIGGGGQALAANAGYVGDWEKFVITSEGFGTMSIRAIGGAYVSAIGGGGQAILVNAGAVNSWERFVATMPFGNAKIAIRTANNHYVSANACGNGGDGTTNAIPDKTWFCESFDLIDVN